MLKIGDTLPDVTLFEYINEATEGCSIGPQPVPARAAAAGKTVVLFAVPGAYTPTCSARHLPGYVEQIEALRAAGADEVWCLAVNDAFVMGAWGREQGANGKVRMLADGSADFARAADLVLDLTAKGLGVRSQRYAAVVVDGVVRALDVESGGQFEVSSAEAALARLKSVKA